MNNATKVILEEPDLLCYLEYSTLKDFVKVLSSNIFKFLTKTRHLQSCTKIVNP